MPSIYDSDELHSDYEVIQIDDVQIPALVGTEIELIPGEHPIARFKKVLSYYLSHEKYFPPVKVFRTHQIDYFVNYLRYYDGAGFYARTLVIEKKYLSATYLRDYAYYYSLGFRKYSKFCKRIHFFQEKISAKQFDRMVLNSNFKKADSYWKSYLGYIVSKPLPNSLFGPSLIRNYDDFFKSQEENEEVGDSASLYRGRRRNFTVTRKYYVNIFGKTIELDTLIYQGRSPLSHHAF